MRRGARLALAALLLAAPLAAVPPLFLDASDAAGLRFVHDHGGTGKRYLPETMGAGGCVLDYDGDGRMDLYLVQSGRLGEPTAGGALYRNVSAKGQVRFEDVTTQTGAAVAAYGQGAVCADHDGDGDTDLYVTAVGPNALLRNEGGKFRDVTQEAGVGDPAWSTSATFFDADADGDLDLYVVNYLEWTLATHRNCKNGLAGVTQYCHPDVYPHAADTFYRNRGDGTFEKLAAWPDPDGKGLGVIAADFDGDGRPDLYVANDSTPNFLFRNLGDKPGEPRFEEVGLLVGAAFNDLGRTEAGMGVTAGDVDGDGFLDLFVTNLSLEANALYLGGAEGVFTYATRRAGLYAPSLRVLGFGTALADLDHDGDLDLVVTNGDVLDNVHLINDGLTWRQPGQVFLNDGKAKFTELSAGETGDFAQPRVGRGLMTLDADDDGRLDLVVSYNGDRARFFHNKASGHWIGFLMRGKAPNTGAIGARMTIEAGGRKQIAEVKTGAGYLTSSDPRLHFGLGMAEKVDRMVIRWPDGTVEERRDLAAGRYWEVREGER